MGRVRRFAAGAAGAVALVLGWPAGAAEPPLSPQEAADQQVVQEVLKAGTFAGIGARRADLQTVLDHAPKRYPLAEVKGGVTIMRDDGQDQAAVLEQLLRAAAANRETQVVRAFNTYPMAAFLLGTYANEMHQPDAAIGFLDRGLAMQPENSHLVSEKAQALFAKRRFPEALALVEPWLKDNPLGGAENRARLLRADGLALTEVGRLDDAEAAYKESLKLQPGHKGALGELDYIAKLRAGAPATAVGMTTGDKARDTGRAAIVPPPKP